MFKNLSNLQTKRHLNGQKVLMGVVPVFLSISSLKISQFVLITHSTRKKFVSSSSVQYGSILEY